MEEIPVFHTSIFVCRVKGTFCTSVNTYRRSCVRVCVCVLVCVLTFDSQLESQRLANDCIVSLRRAVSLGMLT